MSWTGSTPMRLALKFLLVPEGDFDGLGVVDYVVVGEDMSLIINDKAGALALLGDGAEEEIAADYFGAGDVDYGGEGLFVDGDVLELFGVVGGGGVGFGEGEAGVGEVVVVPAKLFGVWCMRPAMAPEGSQRVVRK
jgi:hypothetical protein